MKGFALNAVVVIIIAIASLGLLLVFFSGPFTQMLTDTFCFFNNNVFSALGVNVGRDVCPIETSCKGERVILDSNDKEYVKSQIAARTLLCYRQKLPSCGDESICYQMILKKPLKVALTEEELTQYLESQGACSAIENSLVYDTISEKPYPCGDEDLILWFARDNVIKNQSIVLITYNIKSNVIVIDAGNNVKADMLVCQDAEENGGCATLNTVRGDGYRAACCRQFSTCCITPTTTTLSPIATTTTLFGGTTTTIGVTTTTTTGTCIGTCSAQGYSTGLCTSSAVCSGRKGIDVGKDGCVGPFICCCR